MELTQDLLCSIFFWLDFRSLFRCARVCRLWKRVFYSESTWILRNTDPRITAHELIGSWQIDVWRESFVLNATYDYRVTSLLTELIERPLDMPGRLMRDLLPIGGLKARFDALKKGHDIVYLARRYCPDHSVREGWNDIITWNRCVIDYLTRLRSDFFDQMLELVMKEEYVIYTCEKGDTNHVMINLILIYLEQRLSRPLNIHSTLKNLLGTSLKRGRDGRATDEIAFEKIAFVPPTWKVIKEI